MNAKSTATLAFLACLLAVVFWSCPACATPLLGCGADAILYDVDPATGQASNPRDTGLEHLTGIDFSADGVLYGHSASWIAPYGSRVMFRIDPVTGASTGVQGFQTAYGEGDVGFDPTTGILYLTTSYSIMPDGSPGWADDDHLIHLDLSTNLYANAGYLPGHLDVSGLAFDASGRLFLLDTYGERLLSVDPSDAHILHSVPLSAALGTVAGMDFDPATGVLYVADGCDGGTDMLYTLDTDTGVLTPIGPTGLEGGLAGIAFVPEPGTLALLGLGAILAVRSLTKNKLLGRRRLGD